MPKDEAGQASRRPEPSVFPVDAALAPRERLVLAPAKLPLSRLTLGALGVATRVTGPDTFPRVILQQPFRPGSLTGIDARTVRVFRVEPRTRSVRPVWDSGINTALGFVWSRIDRPGVYVPIGLPRDRLLSETLRALAQERLYRDVRTPDESRELAERIFGPILESREEKIDEIREILTHLEIETSPGAFLPGEVRLGRDGAPLPFPLPGGVSCQELQRWLAGLKIPPAGLPEERLFFPPERPEDIEPPWLILPQVPLPRPVPAPLPGEPLPTPWPSVSPGMLDDRVALGERLLERFEPFARVTVPEILAWLVPSDWWMHHGDAAHIGVTRCSTIRRTNVGTLIERSKMALDGPIVSMPCVVAGKVYVGTSRLPALTGGSLYKIDLATGTVEFKFSFSPLNAKGARQSPHAGVGSSPAVAGGKVYFSALIGVVYCLDAATLACLWTTDLRHADLAHNQPVDHGNARANGWSSPLVVNDRVYVGCGEGESNSFGFVYCLDANTGRVIWLFCTNQLTPGVDNSPNVIPCSSFDPTKGPLPAMFTLAADPLQRGASPWSSPAYCSVLNRIYIGTGNAIPDDPLPDSMYASGLLSLDATTGDFKGFFQPSPADSYRPADDEDVDVPAGPMLFTRGGKRYVCFGSKNGSFFLLDAATMAVKRRRQLLPYDMGNPNAPFENVDPPKAAGTRENKSGVFGTAALASHLKRIFVCLGGYGDDPIDPSTTPFIRALDWATLDDAWPTTADNPPRYSLAEKVIFDTGGEAGLSSPAVVNDVVFVSTTKPALYAFDAETGLCLWKAPGLGPAVVAYALGPAIYENFVVNGTAEDNKTGHLYIYSL